MYREVEKEVERAGRKWKELEGNGRNWKELEGTGRNWKELEGTGRNWNSKQEAQKKFTNNTKDDYALFTLTLQFRSVRFCRRAIFSSFTWIVREHQYRLEVKSIISNPNIPDSVSCRA